MPQLPPAFFAFAIKHSSRCIPPGNMKSYRCEPELAGLVHLAGHPAIIITVHLVVIFPWGIIQNVDFISEKWRTIAHTRHLGYLHLALTFIPLPYIMFYAHLQQISKEYKEMMAAVVVILMAIYHIMRTVFGLRRVPCLEQRFGYAHANT